jgi:hypothetical protein
LFDGQRPAGIGRRVTSLQAADNAKVMGELQFRHVGGLGFMITTETVGAGLLANAVGQAMKVSTDLTPSRASHAPTVIWAGHKTGEQHINLWE